MKKTQEIIVPQGRTGGRSVPSTLLLPGGSNPPLMSSRGSRIHVGKGSGLAMSLRFLGEASGTLGPRRSRVRYNAAISLSLGAPGWWEHRK